MTPSRPPHHPAAPEGLPPRLAADVPAVVGSLALLAGPSVAVLSSRRCPPLLFFAAEAWAAREPRTVVAGFQTPAEAEVLVSRLRAGRPVVVCPARGFARMRVPLAHRDALAAGRLAYASALPDTVRRPTAATADARTRLVVALARDVVVIHAAPGSGTLALAERLAADGRPLFTFDHPENAPLVALGAALLDTP